MNFSHDSHSLMIVYSFIIGYIFSMGLLADKFDDVTNNLNKIYMALLMAFSMGVYWYGYNDNIYMTSMYIILCIIIIILIRLQVAINDKQFLLSIIEHHSAAITMSKKNIKKILKK